MQLAYHRRLTSALVVRCERSLTHSSRQFADNDDAKPARTRTSTPTTTTSTSTNDSEQRASCTSSRRRAPSRRLMRRRRRRLQRTIGYSTVLRGSALYRSSKGLCICYLCMYVCICMCVCARVSARNEMSFFVFFLIRCFFYICLQLVSNEDDVNKNDDNDDALMHAMISSIVAWLTRSAKREVDSESNGNVDQIAALTFLSLSFCLVYFLF